MSSARKTLSSIALLAYATTAYAAFLLSLGWAVGFLADRGAPTSVDGAVTSPVWAALAIDAALLLAFAVQHTVMARAGFKRRLTRLIPAAAERSTFVLAASLLMIALFVWWQPVPGVVWDVDSPWSAAIWVAYATGWLIVVWSTFLVDHADFVGLKQAYGHVHRSRYRSPQFTRRRLYGLTRHPMMTGLLIVFWASPRMTAGHLFFAAGATAYIVVGIRFEERDLRARLGAPYEEYAQQVPALVPTLVPPALRLQGVGHALAGRRLSQPEPAPAGGQHTARSSHRNSRHGELPS